MSNNNDLWQGAHEIRLPCSCCIVQVVGIHSPTSTLFARILCEEEKKHNANIDFLHLLKLMVQECNDATLTAIELLDLGSVWKLVEDNKKKKKDTPSAGRSATKLTRTRLIGSRLVAFNSGDSSFHMGFFEWQQGESLRIHFRPSRFPAVSSVDWRMLPTPPEDDNQLVQFKRRAILHHNVNLGFLVVNKPSGVPSHATVDNGVENVLYQLQLNGFMGCSLPQRLDIETEGLLLVATKSEFSSWMGGLLQNKTKALLLRSGDSSSTTIASSTIAIQKQYRCLVHVQTSKDREDFLQEVHRNNGRIIEHYMDPNSQAPKTFGKEAKEGWLKCVLRILQVGPLMKFPAKGIPQEKREEVQDRQQSSQDTVMEVQVELLTGRTHQIRGQFATMSLPLVGDILYGGQVGIKREHVDWDTVRHRGAASGSKTAAVTTNSLALQCCSLRFPKPVWTTNNKKRPILSHDITNNDDYFAFELQEAWWSDRVLPVL